MRHVRDAPRPLPGDIPPPVRAIVERAMAKDPTARWPSAAALAGVARQAKLALGQQSRTAGHLGQISAAPASPAAPQARAQVPPATRQPPRPPAVAQRPVPTSAPPQPRPPVAAPRPPVVHQPRPPVTHQQAQPPAAVSRPPVAAPPAYPRGAATVPPAPVRQAGPIGYARQLGPPPAPPQRSSSGVVLLVIALAVVVLLCSGVISYNWRKNSAAGDPGVLGIRAVTSGASVAGEGDESFRTPYRRVERLLPGGDETTTSEGRQTR